MRDDAAMTFSLTNRQGRAIQTLEDWRIQASPASEAHWKDGRSAKELAKAWTDGSGPEDLTHLLGLRAETSDFKIASAIAEAQVAFDRHPGGKRNHDLLIRGEAGGGRVNLLATEIYNQAIVTLDWPVAAALSLVVLAVFGTALFAYGRLVGAVDRRLG